MFSRIRTQIYTLFIVCTMLITFGAVLQVTADTEANKALVRRFIDETWNRGNLDVIDEIIATNFVSSASGSSTIEGPEVHKQGNIAIRTAFQDFQMTIEDLIAEGDIVVDRWTATGTHEAEYMGIPPTGVHATVTGISIDRIADGMIVEGSTIQDALGMLQQLGVMDAMGRQDYAWAEASDVTGDPGNPEENKAFIARYLDALSGKDKSPAAVDEYVADADEELKQHIAMFEAAFPRYELIADYMIAEADKVVVRATFRGTHQGDMMGILPTYRDVTAMGNIIYRIADGKIVEHWMSFDELGLIQQLTAPPEPAGTVGTLITDTIYSPSLEGNLLGDPATRDMTIYLPPSYDTSNKHYPVVYLLHGYSEDETASAKRGISSLLDELITAGEMQEMIIVMPDGSNKYGGSFYTNSVLTGNYEDYIVEDIVSHIDAHYRTIPGRDSRAIVGGSMGGHGAMKLAMKHPDVFGAVAAHSPPLYFNAESEGLWAKPIFAAAIAENPDGMMGPHPERGFTTMTYAGSAAFSPNLDNPPFFVDLPFDYPSPEFNDEVWKRWLLHDPLTMLDTYGENLASLRAVFFDSGDQDEFGYQVHVEVFHQALVNRGIEHEYQIVPGGHVDRPSGFLVSLPLISEALLAEEDLEDYTNVFFASLSAGLNMISLPLKPQTPYTASSFAEELSATVVIKLDEARQRFVGFTLDAPDDGFAIEGGKGYIVNVPEGGTSAFVGAAWTNEPPVEAAPLSVVVANPLWSPDGAWAFVVSGKLAQEAKACPERSRRDGYRVTVRNTRTNVVATDVVQSGYFAAAFADMTRKNVVEKGDRLEVTVIARGGEIASETFTYTVTAEAIRQAFLPITLKDIGKPRHSMLLPNYPNPFNPETWIPYQLRESSDVVIRIYDVQGRLVRMLNLGQRTAGFYQNRTRAAYWNGQNKAGEKVASGIYFYQLNAGDFSATRRMLIVK